VYGATYVFVSSIRSWLSGVVLKTKDPTGTTVPYVVGGPRARGAESGPTYPKKERFSFFRILDFRVCLLLWK
jgi:hypothetical protein